MNHFVHTCQSIHIHELQVYLIISNSLDINPRYHIERDKLYVDLNQSAQ